MDARSIPSAPNCGRAPGCAADSAELQSAPSAHTTAMVLKVTTGMTVLANWWVVSQDSCSFRGYSNSPGSAAHATEEFPMPRMKVVQVADPAAGLEVVE